MSEALPEGEELMPTRETAVRGLHGLRRVYLIGTVSPRDYRCRECHHTVSARVLHVLVRYLQKSRSGYDHHHLHWACARDRLLPELSYLEEIPREHAPRPLKKR